MRIKVIVKTKRNFWMARHSTILIATRIRSSVLEMRMGGTHQNPINCNQMCRGS